MKLSAYLYLAGFAFSSAAIITELVEKRRAKQAEAQTWNAAVWDGKESSSSQSVPQHSE
jgi:hypothetical protein